MNWFYATKDQAKAGPVDQTTLDQLFSSGAITGETLVWKQGMDDWKPYSTVFNPPATVAVAGAQSRCSECGQTFPSDQLITLAGRQVCASCKPIAIQKFQEGVVGFGSTASPEELWARVQQRGFNFTIGSVLSRTWDLVKGNFWPSVGITLLCYLIMMGANSIPLIGILGIFLVQPQMMAGLQWYFLKQFRGEPATINDSFAGFQRGFGRQALYMLLISAVVFIALAIIGIFSALFIPLFRGNESSSVLISVFVIFGILLFLAMCAAMMGFLFVPLLILEKNLPLIAAMKLSWRVVYSRFWGILGLMVVIGLLSLLSIFALIIGFIFVLPIAFAAISRIYEDAFGYEKPSDLAT